MARVCAASRDCATRTLIRRICATWHDDCSTTACDVDESFVAENGNSAVCSTDRHRMSLGQFDNGRQLVARQKFSTF